MSAAGAGPAVGWQATGRVDLARLDRTELAQGAGALLLFLALQLPWYTVSTPAVTGSASAMIAGGWRWLIWLISLATVVYLFLRSVTTWRDPSVLADRTRRAQVLAGVAVLNFVLVLIAAFVSKAAPPSVVRLPRGIHVSSGVGAYLGLVLALAVLVAAALGVLEGSPQVGTGFGRRTREPGAAPAPPASPAPPAAPAPEAPIGPAASDSPAPSAAPPRLAPRARRSGPPQRPAEPGSGPPTGWMPPQPPPPPPL